MAWSLTDIDLSFLPVNGTYQTQFAGLCKEHRELESINNLQFTLAEFACSNSWESWLQNPMKFYQSLWGFKKVYKPFQQRNYHKIGRTHNAPHGGNFWLRTQTKKLFDSYNTVLSLLHVRDGPFYFWGGDWANAKKKFPAQLLQKK